MARKKKAVRMSRSSKKSQRVASRKGKRYAEKIGAISKLEGHGKYKSKGIGRAGGAAAGGALATAAGFPMFAPLASLAGGALGDLAESGIGAIIHKIFGSGKYSVDDGTMPLAAGIRRNAFLLPEPGSHVEFGTDSRGDYIRVVKRELVGDVVSSTAPYTVAFSMPLTPCNAQIGPWMAQVANLFQEYAYDGIVFEFVTLTSPTIVSGVPGIQTGGYVGFVTQMNPDLAAPGDKQMALELQASQTQAPWVNQLHPVECERGMSNQPNLFIEGRSGVPTGTPASLYRHGTTYCVVGEQPSAGVKMGEIWSSQAVKLRFPSLDNPFPVNAHWQFTTPGNSTTFGPTAGIVQRTGSTSGITISTPPSGVGLVTFPTSRGSDRWYYLTYSIGNNVAIAAGWGIGGSTASANISFLSFATDYGAIDENFQSQFTPNPGNVYSRFMTGILVKVARVAAGAVATNTITLNRVAPGTPASDNFGDFIVCEIAGIDQAAGLVAPLESKTVVIINGGAAHMSPFAAEAFERVRQWEQLHPTAAPEELARITKSAEGLIASVAADRLKPRKALAMLDMYAKDVLTDDCASN